MGAVYEADGPPGTGKRAIKLLHQEFVKEEIILARFFAESQATRNFVHPNVAQVLETATAEDGTPYLVMELLLGIPVSSYTDQGQALPTPQAVHIVHGTLQALGAAHARGLVHRDIKPDNLFLVHDANGSFHVKVLDFGIAKVMDVAGGMGQKTRTGVLLGTPGYMSPEKIKDSKGVDARADLWSVGIIFYELLTGTSPFPADNEFARLTSVLTEEIQPIEQASPHLAAWAGFFQRALAKDPRVALPERRRDGLRAPRHRPQPLAPPPRHPPGAPACAGPPGRHPPDAPALPGRACSPARAEGPGSPEPLRLPSPGQAHRAVASRRRLRSPPAAPGAPASVGPDDDPDGGHGGEPLRHRPLARVAAVLADAAVGAGVVRRDAGALDVGAPRALDVGSGALAVRRPAMPGQYTPVPAVSQGSIPPPRSGALASTPPPALPSHVVGEVANVGPTHVSAQRPAGTPSHHGITPSIDVVDAPPRFGKGAAWWVVGVVAFVAFGLGLALGLAIG